MDTAFVTGMGAFVSAILVFVGSIFLLMSLVLGARLAYFVTASIALGFILIMAVVWSINPLGPLGQLPKWDEVDVGLQATSLKFDEASQYPDGKWFVAHDDNAAELTQASELENDGTTSVTAQLGKGDLSEFPKDAQLAVTEDSSRLLTQGSTTYGIVMIDILPPAAQPDLGIPTKKQLKAAKKAASGAEEIQPLGQAAVVMKYDPGNPLGKARRIAVGAGILFLLHLIGLSFSERRVRARQQAEAAT
jgi:hypothetical protein